MFVNQGNINTESRKPSLLAMAMVMSPPGKQYAGSIPSPRQEGVPRLPLTMHFVWEVIMMQ